MVDNKSEDSVKSSSEANPSGAEPQGDMMRPGSPPYSQQDFSQALGNSDLWELGNTQSGPITRISINGQSPEDVEKLVSSLEELGFTPKLAVSNTLGDTIRLSGDDVAKLDTYQRLLNAGRIQTPQQHQHIVELDEALQARGLDANTRAQKLGGITEESVEVFRQKLAMRGASSPEPAAQAESNNVRPPQAKPLEAQPVQSVASAPARAVGVEAAGIRAMNRPVSGDFSNAYKDRSVWQSGMTAGGPITRIVTEGRPPEEIKALMENLEQFGFKPKEVTSASLGSTIRLSGDDVSKLGTLHILTNDGLRIKDATALREITEMNEALKASGVSPSGRYALLPGIEEEMLVQMKQRFDLQERRQANAPDANNVRVIPADELPERSAPRATPRPETQITSKDFRFGAENASLWQRQEAQMGRVSSSISTAGKSPSDIQILTKNLEGLGLKPEVTDGTIRLAGEDVGKLRQYQTRVEQSGAKIGREQMAFRREAIAEVEARAARASARAELGPRPENNAKVVAERPRSEEVVSSGTAPDSDVEQPSVSPDVEQPSVSPDVEQPSVSPDVEQPPVAPDVDAPKASAPKIDVPDAPKPPGAIKSFFGKLGRSGGPALGAVIGLGLAGTAKAQGASYGEAAEILGETAIPYGETAIESAKGNVEAASKASVVETASNYGAVLGGAIGSFILGPGLGTGVGVVVGGAAAGFGTDYAIESGAWDATADFTGEVIDTTMDLTMDATLSASIAVVKVANTVDAHLETAGFIADVTWDAASDFALDAASDAWDGTKDLASDITSTVGSFVSDLNPFAEDEPKPFLGASDDPNDPATYRYQDYEMTPEMAAIKDVSGRSNAILGNDDEASPFASPRFESLSDPLRLDKPSLVEYNSRPLSADQLTSLRDWVDQGKMLNAGFNPNAAVMPDESNRQVSALDEKPTEIAPEREIAASPFSMPSLK